MSAHCNDCGTDIVCPAGTWPLGICPVCELRAELAVAQQRVAEAETLLREWLSYTGLRSRAFDPDLDPDDDEYASGRALVTRTDAVLAGSVPDRNEGEA